MSGDQMLAPDPVRMPMAEAPAPDPADDLIVKQEKLEGSITDHPGWPAIQKQFQAAIRRHHNLEYLTDEAMVEMTDEQIGFNYRVGRDVAKELSKILGTVMAKGGKIRVD